MDRHLEGLLGELEATFDASVARAEDEAASDLAFSWQQDRRLTQVALSGEFDVLFEARGALPIRMVGKDYLACDSQAETLVPLGQACLIRRPADNDGAERPVETQTDFLGALRGLARRGASVELTTGRTLRGRLLRATPDHVALRTPAGEVIVGLETVQAVRTTRGG